MGIPQDFISKEEKSFRFKIGRLLASSLSGFITGVIFASIVWILAIFLIRVLEVYYKI